MNCMPELIYDFRLQIADLILRNPKSYIRNVLYSSFLRRTATIVWKWRHVFDHHDLNTILRKRTDSAFAAGSWSFYKYIYSFQT